MASLLRCLGVSLLLYFQFAIATPLNPPPTKVQPHINPVDNDASLNLLPESKADGGIQVRFGSPLDPPPTKVQPRVILANDDDDDDDDETPNLLTKRAAAGSGGHGIWGCFGSFCPRPAPTRPRNYFINGHPQELRLPEPPADPEGTPVPVRATDSGFYYDAWDNQGGVRIRIAPIQQPSPRIDFHIVARVVVNEEPISENFPRRDQHTFPQLIDFRTAAVMIDLPSDVIANARQAARAGRTVRIVVEWSQEYEGH